MDWLDFRYYNRYLRSIYKEKWPIGTHSFRGSGAQGGRHIDCWSLAERCLATAGALGRVNHLPHGWKGKRGRDAIPDPH